MSDDGQISASWLASIQDTVNGMAGSVKLSLHQIGDVEVLAEKNRKAIGHLRGEMASMVHSEIEKDRALLRQTIDALRRDLDTACDEMERRDAPPVVIPAPVLDLPHPTPGLFDAFVSLGVRALEHRHALTFAAALLAVWTAIAAVGVGVPSSTWRALLPHVVSADDDDHDERPDVEDREDGPSENDAVAPGPDYTYGGRD